MKEITPNARGIYAIQVNLKIDKIKLIIALAKRIITNIFLYSGSLVKGIVVKCGRIHIENTNERLLR